jgi:DNA-binding PadR family transcriptional regulator
VSTLDLDTTPFIYVFIIYISKEPAVAVPLTPLSLHILLSLGADPLHGYGILKAIAERTDDEETPSTGALYLALQRLEEEGRIRPCEARPEGADTRRKYWEITPGGRAAVSEQLERMETLLRHGSARAFRAGKATGG